VSTRVAELTPPGTAAIAVLAVVGPRAWEIVRGLFRPAGKPLPATPAIGLFRVGRLGSGAGDEVVLSVRHVEPQPWVEVHCHGGRQVVAWLVESFQAQGCTPADWRDLAGPMRLLRDLTDGLTRAPTVRTAAILLDQVNGALPRKLADLDAALAASDQSTAERLLAELLRFADLGRHLVEPWKVVIAGPPNVGKSSLVNALAGYQRSVVAPIPGTTRDVVTTALAFAGWPVELADTAGLRAAAEELEEAGIARARATLAAADLAVWVLDATMPPIEPDEETRTALADRPLLRVVNKVDQPAAWPLETARADVQVSALTGAGVADLAERIAAALVPEAPPAGAAVPYPPAVAEQLRAARNALGIGDFAAARAAVRAGWCYDE
jgi:tRNA modification GTPase